METHKSSSFSSIGAYLHSLLQTPSRLARRAGSVSTSYEEMSRFRSRSGPEMERTLRWFDLVGFGLGGMVGAGVFVTTGKASHELAGPAIVVSYAIAGLSALLSAFCYTEFAVDMPVAGGAFSYLRVTFGEFAAFLTGVNLIMEYVMSNAAVSRSFTAYFGTAIGVSCAKWRLTVPGLPVGFNEIDLVAVAVVLAITLIICCSSTRESSLVNMVLTVLHILFIAFVILIGFSKGERKNFTEPANPAHPAGFFPFGVSGVFNGAAMVYLSYIGYDAVSTMAEEVKNPARDIPIGVSGSVIIVTALYCLMAASMSMLIPYDMIDIEVPFSAVFHGRGGWRWVSNVIGAGASFGILTSLLVAMLGQSRYMCVIGRSRVVPAWFARVHPRTSNPVNASAFLDRARILMRYGWLKWKAGVAHLWSPCLDIKQSYFQLLTTCKWYEMVQLGFDCSRCSLLQLIFLKTTTSPHKGILTAAIALFTDLDVLLNLVSIGTLFVFYMVANAVIYRRYVSVGTTNPWPTLSFLSSFTFTSIIFTLVWQLVPPGRAKATMLISCAAIAIATLQLFRCMAPQARKPEFWGVPLMPWIPSISIFLNIFLLGSLDGPSYVRFGVFSGIVVLVYVLYGVHASFDAESDGYISQKNSEFVKAVPERSEDP